MSKIVHYLPEFFVTHHGVVEAIFQMALAQKKYKKKFLILSSEKQIKINKNFKKYRLAIKHIFKKRFSIPMFFSLHSKISKSDVFILHSGFTLRNVILSRILFFYNIKYLVWPHGVYIEKNLKRSFFIYLLKKIWIFLFEKRIIRDAKYVIATLDKEKESIVKYFGVNKFKFRTIPFPLNFKKYKSVKKKNVITSVSRADIYTKGIDIALKAFDKSKFSSKYEYKLALSQFDKSKSEINKIISNLHNKKKIKIYVSIYGKSKINLLKSSKIGLFTSRYESFSFSLFESLWYGQECVVSEDMNASELLKKFDICHVCKNSPNSISKKIDLALTQNKNITNKRNKLFSYLSQKNFVKRLYKIV